MFDQLKQDISKLTLNAAKEQQKQEWLLTLNAAKSNKKVFAANTDVQTYHTTRTHTDTHTHTHALTGFLAGVLDAALSVFFLWRYRKFQAKMNTYNASAYP